MHSIQISRLISIQAINEAFQSFNCCRRTLHKAVCRGNPAEYSADQVLAEVIGEIVPYRPMVTITTRAPARVSTTTKPLSLTGNIERPLVSLPFRMRVG
jgi:hypothetical protein